MKTAVFFKLISRLRDPQTGSFRHLWILLFYPVYLISFFILENVTLSYHVVECSADALIPFCEWFLIPYVLWHALIALLSLYLLFFDFQGLKKLIAYFAITYLIAFSAYIIWPTCQNLRPTEFDRDNPLIWLTVHVIYGTDPSTNVSPSMHVLGAIGLWMAARRTPRFSGRFARCCWFIVCLAICLSTVFLKQHSLLDLLTALPAALFGWLVVYSGLIRKKSKPSQLQ